MKDFIVSVAAAAFIIFLSGCSVKTSIIEKERVDQEIAGNRGFISGRGPDLPVPESPRTRKYLGIDVEITGFAAEKDRIPVKKAKPAPDRELWGNRGFLASREAAPEDAFSYEAERVEEVSVVEKPKPAPKPEQKAGSRPQAQKPDYAEYIVKKDDTLSSIAARPEIYGNASRWTFIYEANKDVLKDPARIYPGQILRIPLLDEKSAKGNAVK